MSRSLSFSLSHTPLYAFSFLLCPHFLSTFELDVTVAVQHSQPFLPHRLPSGQEKVNCETNNKWFVSSYSMQFIIILMADSLLKVHTHFLNSSNRG